MIGANTKKKPFAIWPIQKESQYFLQPSHKNMIACAEYIQPFQNTQHSYFTFSFMNK